MKTQPSFLRIAAEWVNAEFPDLETTNKGTLVLYKRVHHSRTQGDTYHWVVSIQIYKGGKVGVWGEGNIQSAYFDLADPKLFDHLREYIMESKPSSMAFTREHLDKERGLTSAGE